MSGEVRDQSDALVDTVRMAARRREPLRIVGTDSKRFLGRRTPYTTELVMREHRGVVSYAPEELVLTARAGTPLREIGEHLAEHGQHLPFDPPRFGDHGGTFGGAIACGLAGPARPFVGAVRDFVLGVRMINGRGQVLRFGGEVMKNVAGYDLSRLVTGAYGTLGVLLDISVKVLPAPRQTRTVQAFMNQREAIDCFTRLRTRALPITGAMWREGELFLRLAGSEQAVEDGSRQLRDALPESTLTQDGGAWDALRDLRLSTLEREEGQALYRLSVAPAARPVDLPGTYVIDWAGAQRWLVSVRPMHEVRNEARAMGGHATRYHAPRTEAEVDSADEPFHPLPPALYAIHRRLKAAFDPHGVLNAGRLYPGL